MGRSQDSNPETLNCQAGFCSPLLRRVAHSQFRHTETEHTPGAFCFVVRWQR